ncbi:MAG: UDP-3-O-acyl-N-acetylglucosamine deacetylase, partial [Pseudomonadota bacterium]
DIDFPDAAIGQQSKTLNLANGCFIRELSDCRTFCRRAEVDYMQSRGLALGGTLDNAIVVDGDAVLNPEGFRRVDECVRHKMLDALGDLALAGLPILGAYTGVRAGHGPTNLLLRKLFSTPGAVRQIECDTAQVRNLPGFGLSARDFAAVG